MSEWLADNLPIGQTLTDNLIRTKAKEFAKELQIDETRFKASAGWVENFKQRHGIRSGIWFGDGLNTRRPRAMGIGGRKDLEPPTGARLQAQIEFEEILMSRPPYEVSSDEEYHMPIRRPLRQAPMEEPSEESGMVVDRPAPSSRPPYRYPSPPPPTSRYQVENPYSLRKYGIPSADTSLPIAQQRSFDHGAMFTDGTEAYMPVADNTVPTINEAEVHLDKLLLFFDTSGKNILKDSERNVFQTVKCVLYQAARGVSIDHHAINGEIPSQTA